VIWCDGTTIAFREEIEEILGQIAARGLPPFGRVVLLLAACRGKVPEASLIEAFLAANFQRDLPRDSARLDLHCTVGNFAEQRLMEVLKALRAIAQLPPRLISTPRGKAILVETVLEDDLLADSAEAARVLAVLRDGLLPEEVQVDRRLGGSDRLIFDLDGLHTGLKRLNAVALEHRARTGLDEAPMPANVELPRAADVQRLLNDLKSDRELQGLARVARDVMAALVLPRSISEAEDFATGGVSDISSRGPIHRLLLSELAHDDLTLAARIALNEAVYLRREPPLHHKPTRLAILVDAGIRLWGTPRVFAAAVAMAFLAKADAKATLLAFRAAGVEAVPIRFQNREGWQEHLAMLETASHPGAALGSFSAKCASEHEELQVAIITHRSAQADPEFLAGLDALAGLQPYLASVDGEGALSVVQRTTRGNHPVCEAQIELRDILLPANENVSLPLKAPEDVPPAIFRQDPFPFVLPVQARLDRSLPFGKGGGLCLTHRGAVWIWDSCMEGARQIQGPLLRGVTCAFFAEESSRRAWAVKFNAGSDGGLRLATIDLDRADVPAGISERTLPKSSRSQPVHVCAADGFLYVALKNYTDVYSLEDSQFVRNISHPRGMVPFFGRFYRNRQEWCRLRYNGLEGVFEPISIPPAVVGETGRVVAFFDRPGREGPWAITANGFFFNTADPKDRFFIKLANPIANVSAFANGLVLWLDCTPAAGAKQRHPGLLVRMVGSGDPKSSGPMERPSARNMECPVEPPVRPVRVQLSAVALSPDGLFLKTKRQTLRLAFRTELQAFKLLPASAPELTETWVPFQPPHDAKEQPYVLSEARFKGGAAYLDSRGLLHLRTGDRTVPEMSFVLADAEPLPAWSSDGIVTGSSFFVPKERAAPASQLLPAFQALISALQ
jgi:hypothetical protein